MTLPRKPRAPKLPRVVWAYAYGDTSILAASSLRSESVPTREADTSEGYEVSPIGRYVLSDPELERARNKVIEASRAVADWGRCWDLVNAIDDLEALEAKRRAGK